MDIRSGKNSPAGWARAGGHEPKGEEGKEDPTVPNQVGDKQKDVLSLEKVV